jgi:hypothetical protein
MAFPRFIPALGAGIFVGLAARRDEGASNCKKSARRCSARIRLPAGAQVKVDRDAVKGAMIHRIRGRCLWMIYRTMRTHARDGRTAGA